MPSELSSCQPDQANTNGGEQGNEQSARPCLPALVCTSRRFKTHQFNPCAAGECWWSSVAMCRKTPSTDDELGREQLAHDLAHQLAIGDVLDFWLQGLHHLAVLLGGGRVQLLNGLFSQGDDLLAGQLSWQEGA